MSSSKPDIFVRRYRDADHTAFREINLEWIEPLFGAEQTDLDLLNDPETHILSKGGQILMAEKASGQALGTVSLILMDDNRVELAKMGVTESARGSGAGRALMQAAIQTARDMGAKRIWIESNRKLDAALSLYRSVGFRELTTDTNLPTPYQRCDIQMELDLND